MTKTDNSNLAAKLELRQYFLRRYHTAHDMSVFDCCQGEGVIWGVLRQEFTVSRYWGVDVKPKTGRLKIDSIRVLKQGVPGNVIDIDTYGPPWRHWFALLGNLSGPVTVFLTIGRFGPNLVSMSSEEFGAIGLMLPRVRKMPGLVHGLVDMAVDYCLAEALKYGTIVECAEAVNRGNARYIGVRLDPRKKEPVVVDTGRKHTKAVKELSHV